MPPTVGGGVVAVVMPITRIRTFEALRGAVNCPGQRCTVVSHPTPVLRLGSRLALLHARLALKGGLGKGHSLPKVAQGAGGRAVLELRSACLGADAPLPASTPPGTLPDHPLRSSGLEMILVTQRIVPGIPAATRFTGHAPLPALCQALCEDLDLH